MRHGSISVQIAVALGESEANAKLTRITAWPYTPKDLVSEGVEASVPATIRETVGTVGRLLEDSDGASVTVARELKLDSSAGLRRVRAAIERGYLKNLEDRKGRPACLVLGDPLPKDVEVLPSVERLQGCTVALALEGIDTPPPPVASEADSEAGERERFAL